MDLAHVLCDCEYIDEEDDNKKPHSEILCLRGQQSRIERGWILGRKEPAAIQSDLIMGGKEENGVSVPNDRYPVSCAIDSWVSCSAGSKEIRTCVLWHKRTKKKRREICV